MPRLRGRGRRVSASQSGLVFKAGVEVATYILTVHMFGHFVVTERRICNLRAGAPLLHGNAEYVDVAFDVSDPLPRLLLRWAPVRKTPRAQRKPPVARAPALALALGLRVRRRARRARRARPLPQAGRLCYIPAYRHGFAPNQGGYSQLPARSPVTRKQP